MITPAMLGLPAKFEQFYPEQHAAVLAVAGSSKRTTVLDAPTGSGKSAAYFGAGSMYTKRFTDGRMLVLVGRKGLQDQLMSDFESMGAQDMRGKGNYVCNDRDDGRSCEVGKCNSGIRCSLKEDGCLYYDQEAVCATAPIVIANYAYWISKGLYGKGDSIGEFKVLVCDEAHTAPEWVSKYCVIALKDKLVRDYMYSCPPAPDVPKMESSQGLGFKQAKVIQDAYIGKVTDPVLIAEFSSWAKECSQPLGIALEEARRQYGGSRGDKLQEINRLVFSMKMLERAADKESTKWVIESTDKGVEITPVWPREFSEPLLFRGIEKVVLSSATINSSVTRKLGIVPRFMDWHSVPSRFPVSRRPFIWVPNKKIKGGIKASMSDKDFRSVVDVIDEIIGGRLDRKGIIHSTAYHWARRIVRESRYSDLMISHTSNTLVSQVNAFKAANGPAVLVSPSVVEGYDFPLGECNYVILFRVPFLDKRQPLTAARSMADATYDFDEPALAIVQAAGRGMRSASDFCEIFILDNNWGNWFKGKSQYPTWFEESWRTLTYVPEAIAMDKGTMPLMPKVGGVGGVGGVSGVDGIRPGGIVSPGVQIGGSDGTSASASTSNKVYTVEPMDWRSKLPR